MTVVCSLSSVIRIALWLAAFALVLGISLGHRQDPGNEHMAPSKAAVEQVGEQPGQK